MVVLLNLLIWVVLFTGIYYSWHIKSWKAVLITILIVLIINQVQPSYFPKGEIVRSKVEGFGDYSGGFEDRVPLPISSEDRTKTHEEVVKRGLLFLEDKQVKLSTTEEMKYE
jgi:hypothetical protein